MMLVHEHTTPPDFAVPDGLVQVTICPVSGLLPNDNCGKTIKDWFIRGKEPKQRCTIHQALRVTTEEGSEQNRVYEVYPPEYRGWAEEEKIPSPPSDAIPIAALERTRSTQSSIGNRQSPIAFPQLPNRPLPNYQISSPNPQSAIGNRQSSRSFRILSPLSGDIFKLDPILRSEYQTIKVSAAIPLQFSDVKLVVNRSEKIPIDGSGAWWRLKKGRQRLQLEARDRNRVVLSKPVTIEVE